MSRDMQGCKGFRVYPQALRRLGFSTEKRPASQDPRTTNGTALGAAGAPPKAFSEDESMAMVYVNPKPLNP